MKPIGIQPRWTPRSLPDRLLVAWLGLLFVALYAPSRVLTRLLGWSKIDWAALDLMSFPGSLLGRASRLLGRRAAAWGNRVNALCHTHLVCRMCPADRQALRDPDGRGLCVWNVRWNRGEFDIVPDFGARNWLSQYGNITNLASFRDLSLPVDRPTEVPGDGRMPAWKSWFIGAVSLAFWVAILLILWTAFSWREYLLSGLHARPASWTDLGPVPAADLRYPPQGLAWTGKRLVFTNHWNDRSSGLYLLDPLPLRIVAESGMPAEAVHTSGLAWDGESLWAVDYRVNRLYRFSWNPDGPHREPAFQASYPTGLEGTSAIASLTVEEIRYLAISDFRRTRSTFLLRADRVPELERSSLPVAADLRYRNGGFSQGLAWDGSYLYEANNNWGIDRIDVIDVRRALKDRDPSKIAFLGSFRGPGPSIEDLATDGRRLWTSDESTYRFYVLEDLDGLRDRMADGTR
jgi:hypothetical protein